MYRGERGEGRGERGEGRERRADLAARALSGRGRRQAPLAPLPPFEMTAELDILYEEGPCLVVCKPPGLPTQAPAGIDSLETQIKAMLRGRPGGYDEPYLGIPHRLDRPASGRWFSARAAERPIG